MNLYISPDFFSEITGISNPTAEYVKAAGFMALEDDLLSILGSSLYNNPLVWTDYMEKLIRMFLVYKTAYYYTIITTNKGGNIGAVKASDTNLLVSNSSMERLQTLWTDKSDKRAKALLKYLRTNYSEFKEYFEDKGLVMTPNLRSCASSGIWLGGKRHLK